MSKQHRTSGEFVQLHYRRHCFATVCTKRILAPLQILFLICLLQNAAAQVTITGSLANNNKPVAFGTISVYQNNKPITSAFTDSTGFFRISNLPAGNTRLLFTAASIKDSAIVVQLTKDTTINLQLENSKQLTAVTVQAKKPLLERQIDRLRFNVAGTDLIFGNSVWDVLEKTPLVTASGDGGLQISGTTGAVVYINNKRKILSGAELKAYLSAIPSENLVAIEVITTPGSRYEAEGGAGIINIITKKRKEDGIEGSATASTRQTKANSQALSTYLNMRNNKWNVYSSVYLSNRRRKPIAGQNIFFPSVTGLTNRYIDTKSLTSAVSYGGNIGVDYEINKNHVIGFIADYTGTTDNKDRIATSYDNYLSVTDSMGISNNEDRLNSNTFSLNINYESKLDASGKRLNMDIDILRYSSTNNSVSKTDALNPANNQFLFVRDYFRSAAPQSVNNQSFKTDFQWPVNQKTTIELGAKASFSTIDNTLLFENNSGAAWVKDFNRSNLFRYNENIIAGYTTLTHTINQKWTTQIGVRIENTIAKGYLEGSRVVDRNYINVFPTGFLKYSPADTKSIVLAVSSRITRPSYWDVNPFRTYTTDQAYFQGNPFLQPSTYYRQELSYTVETKKSNYTFQVAASQTLNEFYSLPYNDSSKVLVSQKTNYGNKYAYSTTAIAYTRLKPWWRLSATVVAGYIISKGGYAGIPIDNKSGYLSFSANQTFTVSKKAGLSCTVITTNTLPVTLVNTRIGNRLETEIRLRKTAGAFNITLSASDWFKSNRDLYRVRANDLLLEQNFYYDLRSVALAVSYNFGKSTVKARRDRDAEFENVKGRIN